MIGKMPKTVQNPQAARRRMLAISLCFLIWAAIVDARLVYIQVFQHEQLAALAEKQQQRTIKITPSRGSILDRKGRELARSIEAESIYVAPNEVKSPQAAAALLARIL